MSDADRRELAAIMAEHARQRSPIATFTRLFPLALKLSGQVNLMTPMGTFSELRAIYGGPAGFCSSYVASNKFLDDVMQAIHVDEALSAILPWAVWRIYTHLISVCINVCKDPVMVRTFLIFSNPCHDLRRDLDADCCYATSVAAWYEVSKRKCGLWRMHRYENKGHHC